MYRRGVLAECLGAGVDLALPGSAHRRVSVLGTLEPAERMGRQGNLGSRVARLPWLIGGAFFPLADARLPPSFYLVALVVVMVNLWMLARAGWDL